MCRHLLNICPESYQYLIIFYLTLDLDKHQGFASVSFASAFVFLFVCDIKNEILKAPDDSHALRMCC